MNTIPVGAPAPAFELRDQAGAPHRLTDYRGRAVVLYFYPEDDTRLCTDQACQFRDAHAELASLGVAVLGVSPDDQASHAAFAAKHKLPFTLLVDAKDASGNPGVSLAYGAWGDKNMYGKIVRGMIRTTYLIGPTGLVAARWDRVKTPGHAQKVLEAARSLTADTQAVKPQARSKPTPKPTPQPASNRASGAARRPKASPKARAKPAAKSRVKR